jgi:ribonuclease HI
MGIGVTLQVGDERHTLSRALPTSGCSNEAEGVAALLALELAHGMGVTDIELLTDSAVLAEELAGHDFSRVPRLKRVFDAAREALARFSHRKVARISRHNNAEADALARSALGLPPRRAPKASRRSRR